MTRIRYNRGSQGQVIKAARELAASDGRTRFVVPTYAGLRIETICPPRWQRHVRVESNGLMTTVEVN